MQAQCIQHNPKDVYVFLSYIVCGVWRASYIENAPLCSFVLILFLCPIVVLIWKENIIIFFLWNDTLSENVLWTADEQKRLPTRQDINVTY
jgi:hypothetical protein